MFFLYQLILLIIFFLSPIIIIIRILKNKEHKKRFIEKIGFFSNLRKKGKLIWFHGSSVGEIMSIIPLIQHYEKNKEITQILITSNTLSSANILKKYNLKKTIHQFFPLDFFLLSKKFINFWNPSVAIFVESEIWPSMYMAINKKKIPLILLNARITNKTFKRWNLLNNFAKSIFKNISSSYPQNYETEVYLKKFKVKKINFIGNLKFIENKKDLEINSDNKINSLFKNYKTWIAASTHKDEEIICAKVHMILKKKIKNLITIIIPRHVNRSQEIVSKIKKLNLKIACHSSNIKNLKNIDIYLVDAYGESSKFYKISKTVFLGKSLIGKGGQNPLEPARYGSKILYGKNVENFKDIYKYLDLLGISTKISNSRSIASSIVFNFLNKNKIKVKTKSKEIFKKTTQEIDKIIENAN